ncbi:MAG TPA: CAP domain-containing protein [Micromonosporaceae bacterium]
MGTPYADRDAARQGGRHRARPGLRRPVAAAVVVAFLLLTVAGVTALTAWRRAPGPTATLMPAPSTPGTPAPDGTPSTRSSSDPVTPSASTPSSTGAGRGADSDVNVPTSTAAPVRTGYTEIENRVVALTNQARAQNGCAPLHTDERLRTAARAHSVDMATHHNLSHTGSDGSTFSDRARAAGYPQPMSENIADGYPTADDVVRAWLNSAGHRSNILNCQTRAVGVGLAYAGDGTPYWTQDFGRV